MPIPTIRLDPNEKNLKETSVSIDPPEKKTHFGSVVALFVFVLLAGGAAFGLGWLGSRIQTKLALAPKQLQGERLASSSSQISGWTLYSDKINLFSIYYPPSWKAQAHDVKDTPGVLLSNSDASVELWLKIDQAVGLSSEQQAGLKSTETKSVEMNGRPTLITTNEYQAGNFFNIVVFPATTGQDQVTFWLKAADQESLDTEMKIVSSFKFD